MGDVFPFFFDHVGVDIYYRADLLFASYDAENLFSSPGSSYQSGSYLWKIIENTSH